MRKTKNKTSFRVDFESLMTNMAIFDASVELISGKITEKTTKTVILNLHYSPNSGSDFIQKHQDTSSKKMLNGSFSFSQVYQNRNGFNQKL